MAVFGNNQRQNFQSAYLVLNKTVENYVCDESYLPLCLTCAQYNRTTAADHGSGGT